jgi:hypothetical protein
LPNPAPSGVALRWSKYTVRGGATFDGSAKPEPRGAVSTPVRNQHFTARSC